MKFKSGDRVRIVNGDGSDIRTDDIGEVVIESSDDLRLWIMSRTLNGFTHYWVRKCDVELLPPPFTDTDRLLFLIGCIRINTPLVELLRGLNETTLDECRALIDLAMEKNHER